MKVLLATPTFSGKSYCFERWINAVSRITYQPLQVCVVDNSDSLNYIASWQHRIPMVHLDLAGETPDRRIALSMEYIRTELFLANKIDFWLDIEVDVLPPPHVVDVMLRQAEGVDFAAAPYRHRKEDRMIRGCFGCSIFSRRIAEVSFKDAPSDRHTDVWWRERVMGKYRLNDVPEHLLRLEHLDS